MKIFIVIAAVILGGAIAAYYYWEQTQPEPKAVEVIAPPPPIAPPKPVLRQVVKVPEAQSPLPQLGESDSFMLEALASCGSGDCASGIFTTWRTTGLGGAIGGGSAVTSTALGSG